MASGQVSPRKVDMVYALLRQHPEWLEGWKKVEGGVAEEVAAPVVAPSPVLELYADSPTPEPEPAPVPVPAAPEHIRVQEIEAVQEPEAAVSDPQPAPIVTSSPPPPPEQLARISLYPEGPTATSLLFGYTPAPAAAEPPPPVYIPECVAEEPVMLPPIPEPAEYVPASEEPVTLQPVPDPAEYAAPVPEATEYAAPPQEAVLYEEASPYVTDEAEASSPPPAHPEPVKVFKLSNSYMTFPTLSPEGKFEWPKRPVAEALPAATALFSEAEVAAALGQYEVPAFHHALPVGIPAEVPVPAQYSAPDDGAFSFAPGSLASTMQHAAPVFSTVEAEPISVPQPIMSAYSYPTAPVGVLTSVTGLPNFSASPPSFSQEVGTSSGYVPGGMTAAPAVDSSSVWGVPPRPPPAFPATQWSTQQAPSSSHLPASTGFTADYPTFQPHLPAFQLVGSSSNFPVISTPSAGSALASFPGASSLGWSTPGFPAYAPAPFPTSSHSFPAPSMPTWGCGFNRF